MSLDQVFNIFSLSDFNDYLFYVSFDEYSSTIDFTYIDFLSFYKDYFDFECYKFSISFYLKRIYIYL